MRIQEQVSLKKLTTLRIGGPARYFVSVRNSEELKDALKFARDHKLSWYVIGEGSNLVPSDRGWRGIIIRVEIDGIRFVGRIVEVGGGENLLSFIHVLNKKGRAGMERMAGIPGSVAGAIYGNAGAYGQEIRNHLLSVTYFDGKSIKELKAAKKHLSYRSSIFKKHKNWIIISAYFRFATGSPRVLEKTSQEIIALRKVKYHPRLKCPGSFFKNIVLDDLSSRERATLLSRVPIEKVLYGKIPAGYLLEQVGAKGMKQGKICIAKHHGNLFYNAGGGSARDIKILAGRLKKKVKRTYGITLEEEVQYVPY